MGKLEETRKLQHTIGCGFILVVLKINHIQHFIWRQNKQNLYKQQLHYISMKTLESLKKITTKEIQTTTTYKEFIETCLVRAEEATLALNITKRTDYRMKTKQGLKQLKQLTELRMML